MLPLRRKEKIAFKWETMNFLTQIFQLTSNVPIWSLMEQLWLILMDQMLEVVLNVQVENVDIVELSIPLIPERWPPIAGLDEEVRTLT